MENFDKIVQFEEYCPKCFYKENSEAEDPCDKCLGNGTNTNSRKPVYFKEEKS